jgi:hypothetical protein
MMLVFIYAMLFALNLRARLRMPAIRVTSSDLAAADRGNNDLQAWQMIDPRQTAPTTVFPN